MKLNTQIKKYRTREGLSQDELAGKIYVSRQTISNWETGRSYPDIHNLLLLSVLFKVSLDELVKGDVEEMKENIKQKTNQMNKLSWVMMIFMILTAVSIGPAWLYLGNKGLVIPVVFYVITMVAALRIEKIKKENDVKTFAEITAFLENGDIDSARAKRDWKKDFRDKTLIVLVFSLIAGLLALISCVVFLF